VLLKDANPELDTLKQVAAWAAGGTGKPIKPMVHTAIEILLSLIFKKFFIDSPRIELHSVTALRNSQPNAVNVCEQVAAWPFISKSIRQATSQANPRDNLFDGTTDLENNLQI